MLTVVIVVGVGVWIVAGFVYGWILVGVGRNGNFQPDGWFTWMQAAETVSYHVWVGALAVLVALWLRRRLGPDPAP